MQTKRERNQASISSLLTSLKGKEVKKADGPDNYWAGKKPNSKMQYLVHPHQIDYQAFSEKNN